MPDPASATEAEPLQEPQLCGKCGHPIRRYDALRHYGWYTAHQEDECIRLLKAEVQQAHAAGVALGREQAAKVVEGYLLPSPDLVIGGERQNELVADMVDAIRALGPQAAGTGREGAA